MVRGDRAMESFWRERYIPCKYPAQAMDCLYIGERGYIAGTKMDYYYPSEEEKAIIKSKTYNFY